MPMKTIEGYSKEKYTDTSVLLAGGGAKALSDFIGSIGWDATNSKITYTPIGGSAASFTVGYATTAGNTDTVDGYHGYEFIRKDTYTSYSWTANYLDTSGTNVPSSVTSNSNWKHVKFTVKKGDKFLVKGRGGTSPRLWAFADTSNKIITRETAEYNSTASYKEITAGQDGYLVINVDISNSYPYDVIPLSYVSGYLTRANITPSISSDSNKIYITVGGVISSSITVPYATSAGSADSAYTVSSWTQVGGGPARYIWMSHSDNSGKAGYDPNVTYNPATGVLSTYILSASQYIYTSTYLQAAQNVIPGDGYGLLWNSGSWWQRLINNDTSDTTQWIFKFQQSEGQSGSSWVDYFTIYKDSACIGSNTILHAGNYLEYARHISFKVGYWYTPAINSKHTNYNSSDTGWRSIKLPVKSGDIFYIKGRGGYDPDLYAFTATDENVKVVSGDAIAWEGSWHTITAGQDGYLYANFNISYDYGLIPISWTPWYLTAGNYTDYVYDKSTSDGRYVYLSGDTMTGHLTVKTANYSNQVTIYRNDAGCNSVINYSNPGGILGKIGFAGSASALGEIPYVELKDGSQYGLLHTGNSSVNANGVGTINNITITNVSNSDTVDNYHGYEFIRKNTYTFISFKDNYYLTNNGTSLGSEVSHSGYKYAKISVYKNDKFLVKASGGSSPRLYSFTDSSNVIKEVATEYLDWTDSYHLITAPQDGFLVVNFNKAAYSNCDIVPLSWVSSYLTRASITPSISTASDKLSITVGGITSASVTVPYATSAGSATTANSAYTVSSWSQTGGSEWRYVWHSHSDNTAKAGYNDGLTFQPSTGTLAATILKSSVTTGTAPLIVASTTAVTNLNVDYVDGYHGYEFIRKDTNTNISFIDGRYLGTDSTNIASSATNLSNWKYVKLTVKKGDKFLIKGDGGSTPRLWAFSDTSNKIITRANAETNYANYTEITAGQDGYLVVNFDKNASPTGDLIPISWVSGFLSRANIYPSISSSGNTVAITVGGVTSSYVTVPYATAAGSAGSAYTVSSFTQVAGSPARYVWMSHSDNGGNAGYHPNLTFDPSTSTLSTYNLSAANIIVGDSGGLLWNSGSWWQRLVVNDTGDTSLWTFKFQQSEGQSGSSWTDYFTIYKTDAYVGSNKVLHEGNYHDYLKHITFKDGYWYTPAVGGKHSSYNSTTSWKSVKVAVKSGDVFYIKGRGGYDPDLYAWTNTSEVVQSVSGDAVSWEGSYHTITAPCDGFLYANFNAGYAYGLIPESWNPGYIHEGNIDSQTVASASYADSAGSASSATDADKVDGYHASDLVKFYLSPMTSGAPADSAKSWFTDTMPSSSGAIVYNVPGSEKTIIAGKSSGSYGHMLQLGYDDNYLRLLRYKAGSWQSTDWEKISAGLADTADTVKTVTYSPSSNVALYPTFVDSSNSTAAYENVYTYGSVAYYPYVNNFNVDNIKGTWVGNFGKVLAYYTKSITGTVSTYANSSYLNCAYGFSGYIQKTGTGTYKVSLTNTSTDKQAGNYQTVQCVITPVYTEASYEMAMINFATYSTSVSRGNSCTWTFYTKRLHCQGSWSTSDFVQLINDIGFTLIIFGYGTGWGVKRDDG